MRCVNVLCGWSNMGMPMSVVRPISLKKRGGGTVDRLWIGFEIWEQMIGSVVFEGPLVRWNGSVVVNIAIAPVLRNEVHLGNFLILSNVAQPGCSRPKNKNKKKGDPFRNVSRYFSVMSSTSSKEGCFKWVNIFRMSAGLTSIWFISWQ